jgi:hypothetical protein
MSDNPFDDAWEEPVEPVTIPAELPDDTEDDEPKTIVFRVSNPQGSVTVTTYINGSVANIDLSPAVSRMSESQLADEIRVIADLARDQARAGQHALLTEFMSELGHDRVYTTGFLRRQIGLPTPEDANDEKSRVFATRYHQTNADWD